MALATQTVIEILQRSGVRVHHVDTSRGSVQLAGVVGRSVLKAVHALRALLLLAAVSWLRRPTVVYHPVNAGPSSWVSLLVVRVSAILGVPAVLHHHSFAYIDAPNRVVARIVSSPHVRHIVLCASMASGLAATYPDLKGQVRVVSNSSLADWSASAPSTGYSEGAPLTVGYLGAVSTEKGIDTAVRTVRKGVLVGHIDRFIVAGPLTGQKERSLLKEAVRQGLPLEYLGVVTGRHKDEFLRICDIILFPSTYAHEAEPLVVLEALSSGVDVVAIRRGCISDMAPEGVGLHVAANKEDFLPLALSVISGLISGEVTSARESLLALKNFINARSTPVDKVVAYILGVESDVSASGQ